MKKLFHKVSKKIFTIIINFFFDMLTLIILVYGPENKQILLQSIKVFLDKGFKKFLIFSGIKSEPNNQLGIDAWKFIPESRLSLLGIVKISDESVSADNGNRNVNNGGIDDKNRDIIHFNTKRDVMVQTNYPLRNINNIQLGTSENY
jgi:hypothetical protein